MSHQIRFSEFPELSKKKWWNSIGFVLIRCLSQRYFLLSCLSHRFTITAKKKVRFFLKAPRRNWTRDNPLTDWEPDRSTNDVFTLSKRTNGIYSTSWLTEFKLLHVYFKLWLNFMSMEWIEAMIYISLTEPYYTWLNLTE